MKPTPPLTIFWFRRDLRLDDNAGLFFALKSNPNVLPIFIFDTGILSLLNNPNDKRVDFIHQAIGELDMQLKKFKSRLMVLHGQPLQVFSKLITEYNVKNVYTNHDYEPSAIERDRAIEEILNLKGITFHSFKDQVIFEKEEVIKDDGKPYTIFTPYMRKWKSLLTDFYIRSYPTEKYTSHFTPLEHVNFISLDQLGFKKTDIKFKLPVLNSIVISKYDQLRDYPSIEGTSRLSVHLRFGTISIRKLVREAKTLNEQWLNELIWREFYMMILYHFPHVVTGSFKKQYDRIPWRNNEQEFQKWCNGETGYPIVDAGMKELNTTGFMHNRVRMITASFLIKHLLIDWRWGEAYFAEKLLDFDLSANNGGWQWAASSGCDAVPYFRIFNPYEQTKRFDPELKYIRKWVPTIDELDYPQPIVEHKFARERVLQTYKKALGNIAS